MWRSRAIRSGRRQTAESGRQCDFGATHGLFESCKPISSGAAPSRVNEDILHLCRCSPDLVLCFEASYKIMLFLNYVWLFWHRAPLICWPSWHTEILWTPSKFRRLQQVPSVWFEPALVSKVDISEFFHRFYSIVHFNVTDALMETTNIKRFQINWKFFLMSSHFLAICSDIQVTRLSTPMFGAVLFSWKRGERRNFPWRHLTQWVHKLLFDGASADEKCHCVVIMSKLSQESSSNDAKIRH